MRTCYYSLLLLVSSSLTTTALECIDAKTERFLVDPDEPIDNDTENCNWLSSRPEKQERYCNPAHDSKAFYLCQKTCGACFDECEDDNSKGASFTDVNGTPRPCSWLKLRPNKNELYCNDGDVAGTLCPVSCGTCPPKPVPVTTPCDALPAGGCSVCGPDSGALPIEFTVPGYETKMSCLLLEESGLVGNISDEQCASIPDFIYDLCQCSSCFDIANGIATVAPTTATPTAGPTTAVPTTAAPTAAPTTAVPTAAPTTGTPSSAPSPSPTDDSWMNAPFFVDLYGALPDVEERWIVLLVFASAAVVALCLVVFLLRCFFCGCCGMGGRNYRKRADMSQITNGGEYAYGSGTTTKSSNNNYYNNDSSMRDLSTIAPSSTTMPSNPPSMRDIDDDGGIYEEPEPPLPPAPFDDSLYRSDRSVASNNSYKSSGNVSA
eukprot:CAMPEP_0194203474 /NCGR_PEP_ID=MMETSP0156-20130528/3232_1 /TAXON_ID=33649 /ORGANISM="Thalassionema nitzschioides, Strain L26-B" /LENGTH=433 /DNA_ID=CAMNT_0038929227 /DNA_START=102 /DNA_END=1403 /DNA_ORIENTATION=-